MTVHELVEKLLEQPNQEAEVKIYNDEIIIVKDINDGGTWKLLGMLPQEVCMEGEFLKVLDSYFENIAVQMGKEAQKVELEIEEDDPKVYKEMCGFAENIWNSCILDTKDWGQEKIYT